METLIKDALAAALASGKPVDVDPINPHQYAIVPDDYHLHDLEEYAEAPRRLKGTVVLTTVASFVAYITRFKTAGSIVLADLGNQKFKAVLDHSLDAINPDWHQHTATYACPLGTAWRTWAKKDCVAMTQNDFAQFIEDNLIDIVEPSSADILLVSKTLQAKKKVDFKSAVALNNGDVQFTYNETTDASAGQISVPQTFTLGIPVFEGGPAYSVTARLRYRINDEGKLHMWYDLLRPQRMVEDAFSEVEKSIREQLGDSVAVYEAAF